MAVRDGIFSARTCTFDRPSPRGLQFVVAFRNPANQARVARPTPVLAGPYGLKKHYGYEEDLTVLGQHWTTVPAWAIDGPPVSRPLAPNMRLPQPAQRVTAARAAFDAAMGVTNS